MSDTRPATERDLRRPECADGNPHDYEVRLDGAIVRKDRWETGMRRVATALGFSPREGFEIEDVLKRLDLVIQYAPTSIINDEEEDN